MILYRIKVENDPVHDHLTESEWNDSKVGMIVPHRTGSVYVSPVVQQ